MLPNVGVGFSRPDDDYCVCIVVGGVLHTPPTTIRLSVYPFFNFIISITASLTTGIGSSVKVVEQSR
jgi:hypothetical protein